MSLNLGAKEYVSHSKMFKSYRTKRLTKRLTGGSTVNKLELELIKEEDEQQHEEVLNVAQETPTKSFYGDGFGVEKALE